MSDYSSKIVQATKWSVITNIFSKITPPVTNIILARLLTPEAFGIVATINMVITFADIFADAGFQKYLVQHDFKDKEELYYSANVAFWTNLSISAILWIIIFFFRNSIADIVGSNGYGKQLSVAAFSIPLIAFSSIQQSIYKRKFDFKGLFFPKLIRSILPLFVTIPLAYFYRNCWALIIGTIVSNLSDALLLTLRSEWKPKFYYSITRLKAMFSFSAWTLLEILAIWFTTSIDVFVIGRILSQYYLGLYKTALTTVDQITTLITTTIIPVLFSALSRLQNDEDNFKKVFFSFQQKCSIFLIPLSFGIYIYSDFVTEILLGNQWLEVSNFIGLLGLIQFLRILVCYFASEVYRSKGNPKISFFIQLMYIVFLVPAIYFSARNGFESLCKVRIISYLFYTIIHLFVLSVKYKINVIHFLKNIKSSLISSILMSLIGYIFTRKIKCAIMQVSSIVLCIIVYFILCLFFKDTRNILKSILHKKNIEDKI